MSEEGGVMPTDSAYALVYEVTPHPRKGALGTWMARSTERRSEHRVGQPGGLRVAEIINHPEISAGVVRELLKYRL